MKTYKEMTEGESMIRAGKGDEQARKELNNRRLARIQAFARVYEYALRSYRSGGGDNTKQEESTK